VREKRVKIKLYEPHAGQAHILKNKRRFNAVPCSRRFGKTELIIDVKFPLIWPAISGDWVIGMFSPVLKDFKKSWLEIVTLYDSLIEKVNNQDNVIYFKSGGQLWLWSLANESQKNNGRGWPFNRVIYEETQKIPNEVLRHNWVEAVRPALSDKLGDAWFIGTANGQDNFFHRMCCKGAKNGDCQFNSDGEPDLVLNDAEDEFLDNEDWITFRMVSTTNPIMSQKEVDSALGEMDEQSHKQEYYSHFIRFGEQMWAYVFGDKEVQKRVFVDTKPIDWREPILIAFDFNKVPMTAIVMQKEYLTQVEMFETKFKYSPQFKKCFKVGIKGDSATIHDTCKAIREWVFLETGTKIGTWETKDNQGNVIKVDRYPCIFPIKVTGDASGNVTSGMVKDDTYYKIIKSELCLMQSAFDVPDANPYHADSWLTVNTLFSKCPGIAVDRVHCADLIKDFFRVKDNGGHGINKGSGEALQADMLDCCRYMFNTFCKDIWAK